MRRASRTRAWKPQTPARRWWRRFASKGLISAEEPYKHDVPHSARSGRRVEPLISLQWFCDMTELAKPAIEVVKDGRVKFHPEKPSAKVYLDWLENIRPWCISRQLWWGHQLPVWYCDACEEIYVSEVAPERCGACDGELRRDEDVLDTWFSSGLWPFATLGWPEETPELRAWYPTDVLSTARDIIFLWVARMVMMGIEFTGEIPFTDVNIHSVIQAPDGRRMSKSLGTGMDPLEAIDEHGADALRFGLLLMSSSQDVRYSDAKIAQGRDLTNKLWNASRLVLLNAGDAKPEHSVKEVEDRWIASRLERTVAEVDRRVEAYDFSGAVAELYRFFWSEFCDWYLEIVKPRLYDSEPEVAGHLVWVLQRFLALAHPFIPFVTEEIWGYVPAGADGAAHRRGLSRGGRVADRSRGRGRDRGRDRADAPGQALARPGGRAGRQRPAGPRRGSGVPAARAGRAARPPRARRDRRRRARERRHPGAARLRRDRSGTGGRADRGARG